MNHTLYALYQDQFTFKEGQISYLIPTHWWQYFVQQNDHISSKQEVVVPPIDLTALVHTDMVFQRNRILQTLQAKLSDVYVSQICACPQPIDLSDWTMITRQAWNIVSPGLLNSLQIMTFYDLKVNQYPLCPPKDHLTKIYIIFSSPTKSKAFIGYLFSKQKLYKAIKSFARQLGFISNRATTFCFPYSHQPTHEYPIKNLRNWTAIKVPGFFIHVNHLVQVRLNFPFAEQQNSQTEAQKENCQKQNTESIDEYKADQYPQKKKIIKKNAKKRQQKEQKIQKRRKKSKKDQANQQLVKKKVSTEHFQLQKLPRKRGRPRKINTVGESKTQMEISTIQKKNGQEKTNEK